MTSTQKQKTVSGGSVTGSLNGAIPGSTAFAGCWCAGTKNQKTTWLFSISPVACWLFVPPGYSGRLLAKLYPKIRKQT